MEGSIALDQVWEFLMKSDDFDEALNTEVFDKNLKASFHELITLTIWALFLVL